MKPYSIILKMVVNQYNYVLLLDASKAFDKVAFNVLFNKLRDSSMCSRITKLLHHKYTNQSFLFLLCEMG